VICVQPRHWRGAVGVVAGHSQSARHILPVRRHYRPLRLNPMARPGQVPGAALGRRADSLRVGSATLQPWGADPPGSGRHNTLRRESVVPGVVAHHPVTNQFLVHARANGKKSRRLRK
jgi:hypothetical protein